MNFNCQVSMAKWRTVCALLGNVSVHEHTHTLDSQKACKEKLTQYLPNLPDP